MAEANSLLNIIVRLNDQATEKFDEMQKKIKPIEAQLKTIGNVGVAGFSALTAAAGYSIYQFSKTGDELLKISEHTGFSVKGLSELKYAADLANISLADIEMASRAMSQTLVEAATGSEDATKSLQLLGLSTKEFIGLNPEQAFFKVAEAVSKIEDPMLKAAAAKQVFGRQATMLIPLLNEGSRGMEQLRKQANDLGVTFDDKTARAAAEFNDAMTRLKASFQGVTYAIGSALAPVLQIFVDLLAPIVAFVGRLIKDHPILTTVIIGTATAFFGMLAALRGFLAIQAAVRGALAAIGIAANAALGSIGLILGIISVGIGIFAGFAAATKASTDATGELDAAMKKAGGTFGANMDAIVGTSDAFKKLGDEAKDTAKKIEDVEKRITDLVKDNSQKQQTYKENLAQAFIDQEDKVAKLRNDIQEKQRDAALNGLNAQSSEELAVLNNQLTQEQAALQGMAQYKAGIEAELVEMRRRANLTEFELKVENLMRERIQDLTAFKEKLETLMAEREEYRKHYADLKAQMEDYTAKVQAEQAAQAAAVTNATSTILSSLSQRNQAMGNGQQVWSGIGGATTPAFVPRFAAGGIVNGPTLAMVGEAGPEAIVPLNRGGGFGGGINIQIFGDVSGEDLIEKVKQGLMRGLRYDSKISGL